MSERDALADQILRDAAVLQRIGTMILDADVCDDYQPYKGPACWNCNADDLSHAIKALLKESQGPRVMVCRVCQRPIDRSSPTELQAYVSAEGATCAACYRPMSEASR